jgi:hypothetical protein
MIMRLTSMCKADHIRSNVRLDILVMVTDIHFVIRLQGLQELPGLLGLQVIM